MANLSQVVSQLHKERKRVQLDLTRLDDAIQALSSNGSGANRNTSSRPHRSMSVAARKRIADAQRARWAKWKAKQKKAD